MNPTVELVLNHKKANMRKSEFLMLEALKSAPHLNDRRTSTEWHTVILIYVQFVLLFVLTIWQFSAGQKI